MARQQGRSTQAALRDALEVFSARDPAFPQQQSLEFRTERLVAYCRLLMQENENLHAKMALTEKQRDRVRFYEPVFCQLVSVGHKGFSLRRNTEPGYQTPAQ